jgi:parallel beta-helix repeat protein
MRGNRLERNGIGIFFCWGVQFGLAQDNKIDGNRNYGISIGHRDTDNLIRGNHVSDSGKVGVLFRDDTRGKDFWPNRNRLEENHIVDSGAESGIGVDIQGKTRNVTLVKNEIRETREPMQRTGVRIGEKTKDITLTENTIDGFSVTVADLHAK